MGDGYHVSIWMSVKITSLIFRLEEARRTPFCCACADALLASATGLTGIEACRFDECTDIVVPSMMTVTFTYLLFAYRYFYLL